MDMGMNMAMVTAVMLRTRNSYAHRRHSKLPRRATGEWALRGLLAMVVLFVGGQALTFSLAQMLTSRNPTLAHQLAPYDGRITARLAAALASPEVTTADRRRANVMAKRALRQDATTVAAVTALGLDAQVRDDTTSARSLMKYAEKLSRRNPQMQLWAIEDAVSRSDVNDALRHYDVALRVNPTLSQILYPVLVSAVGSKNVRMALAHTLAQGPAWAESFINFLPANVPDPIAGAAFLTDLRRMKISVSQAAQTEMVDTLLVKASNEEAWSFYAATNPGVDRRRSRDSDFSAMSDTPSRFDWTIVNEAGISTSIQRTGSHGLFEFVVSSGTGGALLQQVQLLPPGRYRLEGRSSNIDQPAPALPYWVLTCPDGRELGRVEVNNSASSSSNFSGQFDVPSNCPLQTLLLVARPSDAVAGLSGQIEHVTLVPLA